MDEEAFKTWIYRMEGSGVMSGVSANTILRFVSELEKEIETLRLDNTYLQQRLKKEVEK